MSAVPAPCSCHRTRSTTSAGVNHRGCSQLRLECPPPSSSSSMRRPVQTSRTARMRSMNSSAPTRNANASWSTRSSGGSKCCSTSNSGGGVRATTRACSRPAARSCAKAPAAPKRRRTSSAGSAANSPRVRTPSRVSSVVVRGSTTSPTGSGAMKAADAPGGTIATADSRAARAACSAANGPSAMPTRAPGTPSSGDGLEEGRRRGLLAAVVACGPAGAHGEGAGPDELHAGHGGLDAAHDGLEHAQVEGGVVVEHDEPGGAVLRLAQLQPARDAVAARGGGAGEHEAVLGEGDGRRRVEPLLAAHGEDRPVGAPQHDGAAGVGGHPVALRSRSSRRIGSAGSPVARVGGGELQRTAGQPQPRPGASHELAAAGHAHGDLALDEVPVAAFEPLPLARLDPEPGVAARPVARDEQRRAALAETCLQPARLGGGDAPRRPHRDHGDDVGEGGDDGEPLAPRIGHEHEPLEGDAEPGRGLDAELGHARHRDPAPARARPREQGHEQGRRPLDLHDRALAEGAARQHRFERRMRRHGLGVEPRGLHPADAGLQLLDACRPRGGGDEGSGHGHTPVSNICSNTASRRMPTVHPAFRGHPGGPPATAQRHPDAAIRGIRP